MDAIHYKIKENHQYIAYYEEVETQEEYNGYFCSVAEAITIAMRLEKCKSDTPMGSK